MAFPGHIWDQLKSLTADDLVRALERDGWKRDTHGGSQYIYRKAGIKRPDSRGVPRRPIKVIEQDSRSMPGAGFF